MNARFVFKPSKWFTERTYDTNFMCLPDKPGVYLIVIRDMRNISIGKMRHKVMYVGSSKNLKNRCYRHDVEKQINSDLPPMVDAVIFFLPCENYIEEEKRLIKLTQARYNKQWR
jgi:excinuclease UvrABC nuclease subunit